MTSHALAHQHSKGSLRSSSGDVGNSMLISSDGSMNSFLAVHLDGSLVRSSAAANRVCVGLFGMSCSEVSGFGFSGRSFLDVSGCDSTLVLGSTLACASFLSSPFLSPFLLVLFLEPDLDLDLEPLLARRLIPDLSLSRVRTFLSNMLVLIRPCTLCLTDFDPNIEERIELKLVVPWRETAATPTDNRLTLSYTISCVYERARRYSYNRMLISVTSDTSPFLTVCPPVIMNRATARHASP
mmetsp:Transcript_42396/g.51411  ORF Transcript_42396/g.51411 Transcript_42396/m.51411 type:complete len:240 (-) Transcript_42396:46-765(-)